MIKEALNRIPEAAVSEIESTDLCVGDYFHYLSPVEYQDWAIYTCDQTVQSKNKTGRIIATVVHPGIGQRHKGEPHVIPREATVRRFDHPEVILIPDAVFDPPSKPPLFDPNGPQNLYSVRFCTHPPRFRRQFPATGTFKGALDSTCLLCGEEVF